MAVKTLSAGPIVNVINDPFIFIPGPAAYPPLDPVSSVIQFLTATVIAVVAGMFPGATEYPGADEYPGRGSTLAVEQMTPKTLTGVPV